MSNTGMPPRRAGAARTALLGMLGLAVVIGGGWFALGRLQPERASALVTLVRLTGTKLLQSVTTGAATTSPPIEAAPANPPATAASADTMKRVAAPEAAHEAAPEADHETDDATPRTPANVAHPARSASSAPPATAPSVGGGSTPAHRIAEATLTTSGKTASPAKRNDTPAPAASAPPSFDIVRVAPGGATVVAGRAAPDADVALLDNGRVIAKAKADESGQFVAIPDKPLPVGGQELALREDRPGAASIAGDAPALVVVPRSPHGSTGATGGRSDKLVAPAEQAVAVLTPPDAAPRLLSVPSDAGGPPGQVVLRVVDYDAKGEIRFAGTARPGTIVRLYVDNHLIGEAPVDAQGRWGLAPGKPIAGGAHRLRADDIGAGGKVLSRAELPFQRASFGTDVAAATHESPTHEGRTHEDQVVVQPHQSLWRIARDVYGEGTRYTVIYAANRDQIRDPNRIYPGQVFTLPPEDATAR